VIVIADIPIERTHIHTDTRKIGEKEITVENIQPQFRSEEEWDNAKSSATQLLYEIFSKYTEKC
jgi:hypothetical protein